MNVFGHEDPSPDVELILDPGGTYRVDQEALSVFAFEEGSSSETREGQLVRVPGDVETLVLGFLFLDVRH